MLQNVFFYIKLFKWTMTNILELQCAQGMKQLKPDLYERYRRKFWTYSQASEKILRYLKKKQLKDSSQLLAWWQENQALSLYQTV